MGLLQPRTAAVRWRFAVVLALAVLLSLTKTLAAEVIDATWIGGTGNWNNASNWNPEGVPNNGGDTYNVLIDGDGGTASLLTLNMPAAIDNLSVDDGDELAIDDGKSLTIEASGAAAGTINNAGTISLNAWWASTYLYASGGDVTLVGGGIVALHDPTYDQIRGSAGTERLVNQDNTIQGAGRIANNAMALTNQGTIDANLAAQRLTIDPNAAGATNSGTMRSSGTGILKLTGGTFANTGGTIEARDSSRVELDGATINGGTVQAVDSAVVKLSNNAVVAGAALATSGTGKIQTDGSATLDGVQIANAAALQTTNGSSTTLKGTITNGGDLALGGSSLLTYLHVGGTEVTLSGGGTVTLSNYADNRVRGSVGTERLINQDNTIRGAGQLGNNAMALTNLGTIEANQSNPLVVDLSGPGIHDGVMKATSGGTLVVKDALSGSGSWLADGGKIQLDSGVSVSTTGPITITNGGELELNDAAISGSDLLIDATGTIDVASTVSLAGNLSFAMTDEARWAWATGSRLEMTGGIGAALGDWGSWPSLEIGGYDFGPSTGFSSNFELPELRIGPDAHLRMIDLIDNGNCGGPAGPSEALYVGTLSFADTLGQLDLNGLHLYYGSLSGDPGQIIDSIVPEPSSLVALLSMVSLSLAAFARRRRRQGSERTPECSKE